MLKIYNTSPATRGEKAIQIDSGIECMAHRYSHMSCLCFRYLHIIVIFWSFLAGVVTFYCSLGPETLLPNILITIKPKKKVCFNLKEDLTTVQWRM